MSWHLLCRSIRLVGTTVNGGPFIAAYRRRDGSKQECLVVESTLLLKPGRLHSLAQRYAAHTCSSSRRSSYTQANTVQDATRPPVSAHSPLPTYAPRPQSPHDRSQFQPHPRHHHHHLPPPRWTLRGTARRMTTTDS